MNFLEVLEKKKCQKELSEQEIRFWVEGICAGSIPDYQSAALLMAIRLNGMNFEETLHLTKAMTSSGDRLAFPGYATLADKHSTGGVGDKVTLILAPLVAACGLPTVMLSGRGLGFSGGTIDKFEAVEGVSCDHDLSSMQHMLAACGWANAAASPSIAPADKVLYALRDVTATVDSIPLITASILSKKLAGGATHLCLDVKCGEAAFMQSHEDASALANNLKAIGEMGGLSVAGVISRMSEPLGHAIGNYLEVLESVQYLQNPPQTPLMALVYKLGTIMLLQGQVCQSAEQARSAMMKALGSGLALEKFMAYLRYCGGKPPALDRVLKDRYDDFPSVVIPAPSSGFLTEIQGRAIGEFLVTLGAGRQTKQDQIDPLAGMLLCAHVGDEVQAKQPLCRLFGEKALAQGAALVPKVQSFFRVEHQASPAASTILDAF